MLSALFGQNVPAARAYAGLLAGDGVLRGVVGPREAGRVWTRHLLNCAVVAELVPAGASVADIGSGAGLPGIPLALARPDLSVTLVEPLRRRCDFLTSVLARVELPRVRVVRGRAPDVAPELGRPDVVVARALAPLDRLALWCLPLLAPGGRLLALRGQRAEHEVEQSAAAVRAAGGRDVTVVRCGVGVVDEVATVVSMVRRDAPARAAGVPVVRRPVGRGRGRGSAPRFT